jgi:3-hydroxyacyl-CoA dehydrogenase
MDWKLDLYTSASRRRWHAHAIVASNTSGLSITKLSEALPEAIKPASAASTSSTRRATWRWWS